MQSPSISQHYANLPPLLHTQIVPIPVEAPTLVIGNDKLAASLGISREWLHSEEALKLLSGNEAALHGKPLAMAYAGHQFGGFNHSLGDGRAMLLGDVLGVDGQTYELHLKGTGRTVYSRGADGRATLSAMLREYIISEAMAALQVPTTRSLAVVSTGERVWRQRPEIGAVLTRVAKSHVRVGTFQYLAARQEVDAIRTLMNHEIARHMPGVSGARAFLAEVITRQTRLIAQWMSFGFIHGVMNTDNMQIAGETIDYGPCAFMDVFHPQKVFSSIDENGRYAYDKQPVIGLWNLTRLAECLLPLLDEQRDAAIKIAEAELRKFMPQFEAVFEQRFLAKLGIENQPQTQFITKTMVEMANRRLDFTQFFTALTRGLDVDMTSEWKAERQSLLSPNAQTLMETNNPVYIARNHRVEEALVQATENNFAPLHRLLLAVQQPYAAREEFADLENAPGAHEEVLQTFCGT